MQPDVLVAGLGAMGSASAWRMARSGLKVLGFDRFSPPHALGSSHGGSRIIREMAFEHPRYVPMARRSFELWAELSELTGARLLTPCGALYLGSPSSSVVAGSRQSAVEHGVESAEFTAAEVRSRWPVFNPDPGMVGLLEHRAGVLNPEACVAAALGAARGAGAELHFDETVEAWSAGAGGVRVTTGRGTYEAARLVLAGGPWMPELLAMAGASPVLEVERVIQHWFEPARTPELLVPGSCPVFLWEDEAGVVFYGFPLLDGAVKCAIHHRGRIAPIDGLVREVAAGEVERARSYLERFVPPAAGRYLRSAVCVYTNTRSGDFLLDRHPAHDNVVVLSPCSGIGFKFAPLIGELASELVRGLRPSVAMDAFSWRVSNGVMGDA